METFVGDTIKIVLMTYVDLSGYALLQMKFKKPSGRTGFWAAIISLSDQTWMEYTTLATDIDEPGEWTIQAHVEDPGVSLHGLFANFTALTPFPETTKPPTTPGPTTAAP